MKKILFAVLFFAPIFLFLSPKNSHAQGTCVCTTFLEDCMQPVGNGDCATGYHASCGFYPSCDCTCRANPTVPPPPGTPPGSGDLMCAEGTGIQTAIGCIHVLGSQEQFLGDILKWAVGIGGGIAFLLMLYAGFMIMTSAGNPERLKAGQELLTSAISGLILLIFSVFILKFIGVDILGLGSFGFGP